MSAWPYRRSVIIVLSALLTGMMGVAWADAQRPYSIKIWGAFRDLILQGDFSPKVRLGDAMSEWPIIGVGAIADARGEITILDGKLILSYGRDGDQPRPESENAALLVVGSAPDWDELQVDDDVPPQKVDGYIAGVAESRGMAAGTSFPFKVRGAVIAYTMHVNAEPTRGPHGMSQPMAVSVERSGEELGGTVAGVFVAPNLMGIATHGGERTHAHWVSEDETSTAHLDRWGIKGGSRLLLPAK